MEMKEYTRDVTRIQSSKKKKRKRSCEETQHKKQTVLTTNTTLQSSIQIHLLLDWLNVSMYEPLIVSLS
jgi:hypothetical protein